MADIMQTQGQLANQNPNILSKTYSGAQADTTTPMTKPATTPTTAPEAPATTAPAPLQIPTNVPGMAQANTMAQNLSTQLYQGGPVAGLESNKEAQLKELFSYDQNLDKIYQGQSPYPQTAGYVENPADRLSGLANVYGQTASNIGKTVGQIDVTERAYNTAISSVLDRFISFAQMQQTQAQNDKDYELKRQQLELEKQKAGGGAKTMAGVIASLKAAQGLPEDQKQNALLDALAQVEPGQTDAVMNIWKSLGANTGGTDEQALLKAMEYPGADEVLRMTSDDNRPALARQIISRGGTTGITTGSTNVNLATQQGAEKMYNQLLQSYRAVPSSIKGGNVSGLMGNIAASTQWNKQAESYELLRDQLAMALARLDTGATGNVSKEIIENYKRGIPSFYTSDEASYQSFANLYDRIASKHAAYTNEQLPSAMTASQGVANNQNIAMLPSFKAGGGLPQAAPSAIGVTAAGQNTPTVQGSPLDQKIMVKNKATGVPGMLSIRYFDPNKYERM